MANISSLISNMESGLNALDNSKGKIENAKSKFSKDIGVSKEMADKAEDLIDTFDDMDKAYEEHKDIVEECDKEIQKLSNSISQLQANLSKATTQQGKDKIQNEIDKKQRQLIDQQSKRDVNARKRDEAEAKRDKANRRFDKLFGRRIAMGDITALNDKNHAISAISKGGKFGKMANGLKGLKGNPYMMIAEGLVKAVEFGIGKMTEYAKVSTENYLKEMNAVTAVSFNAMRSNIASWQDAMDGAYVSQMAQIDNYSEIIKASNAIALNNLKLANTWTNWIPIWGTLNKLEEEELAMRQQVAEADIANAQKLIGQVQEFTKKTDDYLRKQDSAIHQYQIQNGLTTQQTKIYEERMLSQGKTFSEYNKTVEDVIKLQTNYIQQSGRSVNFSNEDMTKTLAVGRLVGDDNFAQFSASMNIFNQSVSSSADIMYDMYNYANKMGLSQQKLTKNVLSNLKLANKYDFKNGSKGFIELAKWAENVRFNLNSLGNMLEKIQGGGLEGTIQNSAKLQVLGGNFAMGSDPLAMMWEGFNDPDMYAKRIKGMFNGLGRFDSKTGETTFNANDTLLIRQAAEALGMTVEDAKDMIREENKKSVIRRQVHNSNLSKEQMDAVANKAQRNAETGRWEVTMLDNTVKDISTLTPADLQNILSDNSDENIERYSKGTLSSVEKIESATKEINAKLGVVTFDNFVETANNNIESMLNAYTSNLNEIVNTVKQQRLDASKEQEELLQKLNNIFQEYTSSMASISESKIKAEHAYKKLKADIEQKETEKNINIAQTNKEQLDFQKDYENAGNFITRAWYKGRLAEGEVLKENGAIRDGSSVGSMSAGMTGLKVFFTSLFDDGIVSSQGTPMAVAASNVTPIQDGSVKLAKSDPRDSAIFAKEGGPFDTLFNGVFNTVNRIYDSINSISPESIIDINKSVISEIAPRSMQYEMPIENISHYNHKTSEDYKSKIYTKENQTIDIRVHGDLRLNTDGKTIDISKVIETDPMFIKRITELILTQIDENMYGGKQTSIFHTRPKRYF